MDMRETVQNGGSLHCGDVHELRTGVATATASRRQRSFPRSEPLTPSTAWQRRSTFKLQHHIVSCKTSNLRKFSCRLYIAHHAYRQVPLSSAACFGVRWCHQSLARGPVYHCVSALQSPHLHASFTPRTENHNPRSARSIAH